MSALGERADAALEAMREDTMHPWASRLAAAIEARSALTEAEARTLTALSYGLTVGMAAEVYGIAPSTVHTQLASARARLGAKNTTHAVALALRVGAIR